MSNVVYEWRYLWNEESVTVNGYPAKLKGVKFRPALTTKPSAIAK